jgi:arylsulfatase A-like enzyme
MKKRNSKHQWNRVFFQILLILCPVLLSAQSNTRPNIVVILSDDQGYADISYNPLHQSEVSTPNMDNLAREGIFFTQAYITGNVCSPTRAGLLTGRYQQRAGIYTAGEGGNGLSLEEKIFPQYLKDAGYVSGAFGKWHLGLTPEFNPASRGFDEFYGFMGRGAHDYYRLSNAKDPIYRNLDKINDKGYLTTRLTEEAVDFIDNHKAEPFFLYLAYNAVHYPQQAPEEDIKLFNTGDPDRDILMAMIKHLDMGVGEVVTKLKKEGIWENTILVFLTDNGGSEKMHANNTPLRGYKQTNYEGGVRTPFIISWPERFKGGRQISTPIVSLDILPTVLDAIGVQEPVEKSLDGKSILPVIEASKAELHENLFWSEGSSRGTWAVRSGDWKLVVKKEQVELFNLAMDVSESKDLSDKHPDIVKEMSALYDSWLEEMADPMNKKTSKRWVAKK